MPYVYENLVFTFDDILISLAFSSMWCHCQWSRDCQATLCCVGYNSLNIGLQFFYSLTEVSFIFVGTDQFLWINRQWFWYLNLWFWYFSSWIWWSTIPPRSRTQTTISYLKSLNENHDIWHGKSWWGPCLGQAQKCGRVKLENPNPPHILSLDSNVNKIVLNMNISISKYSSWKYLPVNIFMTWCKITYTISQLTLSCRGSLC
jgi:hypothetical protein